MATGYEDLIPSKTAISGYEDLVPKKTSAPKKRSTVGEILAPVEAIGQGFSSGAANVMMGGQQLLGKGLSALGAAARLAPSQYRQ